MKYFKKFTLLEVMIVSILLSSLLASVYYIMVQALQNYEENSKLMVFEFRVSTVMNKFKKVLKTAYIRDKSPAVAVPLLATGDIGDIIPPPTADPFPEFEKILNRQISSSFPPGPLQIGQNYYFISYSKPDVDLTVIDPGTGDYSVNFDPGTGSIIWDLRNFIGLGPPVLPLNRIPAPPILPLPNPANPALLVNTPVEYREPIEYLLRWLPTATSVQRQNKALRQYFVVPMNPLPNQLLVVTPVAPIVSPTVITSTVITSMDGLLPTSSIVIVRENTLGTGKAIAIRLNFLFFDPSIADFDPRDDLIINIQRKAYKTARATLRAKSVIFFSNSQPD